MKSFALLFVSLILPLSVQASDMDRWIVREAQPDGRVRVRIIEGDKDQTASDTVVKQDVVFDQIMSAADAKNLDMDHAAPLPFVQPKAGKPLWVPVKNAWTAADEDAYSTWFAANANTTFLNDTDIIVDCADTGLLFRWVYARNNHMPIANTLSGSGRLFGHFSSNADWDQLATDADWKKDERFKAALRYLFANTYTGTVVGDIAPVTISTAYVRPGAMFMIIRPSSGHTQSIVAIDPTEGPQTLWGNEPASQVIMQTPLLVETENKQTLGVWREPRLTTANSWELIPATQMPGYSLEQFQQKFQDASAYTMWLDDQIGVHLTNLSKLQMWSQSFGVGLDLRLSVSVQSYFVCYQHPSDCAPGSQNYNDYSTNSRDARLVDLQKQIGTLLQQLGPNDPDVQTWKAQHVGSTPFIFGTTVSGFQAMLDASVVASWNPDPRVSFATRWGLKDTSATDTNFDFYMQSTMLFLIAYDREMAQWNPSPQELDQLDAQAKQVFSKMQSDRAASTFNVSTFSDILSDYEARFMYVPNVSGVAGCNQNECTINALTWGEDGHSDIVDKWSSATNASPAASWGL